METLEKSIARHASEPYVALSAASLLAWSLLLGFSLNWYLESLHRDQIQLATQSARNNWNKDAAFRRWASRHGGLYVKPDLRTPPNPYLAHLPNRDLVTSDGTRLTLMNPAYMMRQMVQEFEEMYGVKGKITGKVLLNPANAPDQWETRVLDRFAEENIDEAVDETLIEGEPFLRYMRPMYMTEGCVTCHGHLGFHDGDLRGGVSIAIPLKPFLAAFADNARTAWWTHGIIWLIGCVGMTAFGLIMHRRQRERRDLLQQLEHGALHDKLTGLPNRALFLERLQQAMQELRQGGGTAFHVGFMDLDRFKNLNDSYGHSVGDRVLRLVAERLRRALRPGDTAARMGGDEFTFLFHGALNNDEAIQIAQRLLDAVRQPLALDDNHLSVDASIGLCAGHPSYRHREEIVRDADTAMYRAKATGKGRVDLFDPGMHEAVRHLALMEQGLKQAVAQEQLELYYQPVVDVAEGRIRGFEALLRWTHPELGRVPPDRFIPVAEETGAIHEIGEWVLRQACRQVHDWNLEFERDQGFFVSVNLSAKQAVSEQLLAKVQNALELSRLPAKLLHCEITETTLLDDQPAARQHLAALRDMGIGLNADDFGKGYCSLTYLQEFEFDTLKIDKQFVQDMSAAGRGLKLVKTLLMLSRDLDMNVIAEGVETEDQYNRLRAMGCRWMQGYLLSPPHTASRIRSMLREGAHGNLAVLQGLAGLSTGRQPAGGGETADINVLHPK